LTTLICSGPQGHGAVEGRKTIAIVLPSNNIAGPQKLAALCAQDLVANGFDVEVLVPRLPYWFYYITLRGDFRHILRWLRLATASLWSWLSSRSFSFQDLASSSVNYRSVLRRPRRRHLAHVDVVVVMSIEHVIGLADMFQPERTIYYLLHPEEIGLGCAERLRAARSAFRGTVIALSPCTRDAVADHVDCSAIVPAAIAPVFYRHVGAVGESPRPKEILLHYSAGITRGGQLGLDLIDAICSARPQTTVTIWTRDSDPGIDGIEVVSGLSDEELCQCYLTHSFLLFPSTFEGAGMPPLEAMACGCIPILRAGVGAADTYANSENAVLLSPDIVTDAEVIVNLLNNPSMATKMRAKTREALLPFNPSGYGVRLLAGMTEASNSTPVVEPVGGPVVS
jgi:glycosyltransferase involved in cell wall biosynthesis